MNEIYLKFPTIEDKEERLNYVKEIKLENPNAKPGDFKEKILYEEWLNNLINEHNNVNLEKNYDSSGFIVAEIDNQIVGFCRYIDNNSFSKQIEDADCELSVMYVKPNMKRSGIGSKLFFYVLNEFYKKDKELMVIWCFKENQPAINFYQKMGGTIISEKVKEHGGKENKEICFGYNIKELIKSRKI